MPARQALDAGLCNRRSREGGAAHAATGSRLMQGQTDRTRTAQRLEFEQYRNAVILRTTDAEITMHAKLIVFECAQVIQTL